MQAQSWFEPLRVKAHCPKPISLWRSGKEGVADRKLGWRQWRQNQEFIQGPRFLQPSSYSTHQKHRCLAESTRYYGNRYSFSVCIILWIFCAHYDVTPLPTFRAKTTALEHPLMYVTNLALENYALSCHVKTKCVTNSYTLIYEPSLLQLYMENPSFNRAA